MNRYSRTVTASKSQGASQVTLLSFLAWYKEGSLIVGHFLWKRPCCTLRTGSTSIQISRSPWLVSLTSGKSLHFSAGTSQNSCRQFKVRGKSVSTFPFNLIPAKRTENGLDRCNKHVLVLGGRIKASLQAANLTGYQFGTVGVSDGISMGTFGMSYSLQSRDLIADQVETAAGGHWLDGMVTIPVSLRFLYSR